MGQIVHEGQLKGEFSGFNTHGTKFVFDNGSVWTQAEHKYWYHYAYMPHAKIVADGGALYLCVCGESVQVRQA